jgi:DNA invertase Pin-like site-specific DNA recombinase
MMPEKIYNADIYLRLSKDDGDKEESDSIANQRALILDYVKSMPDIRVHKIRVDDGYSGIDFNRPAFTEMIDDIKAGIADCVIVKDFSRFARNYIEAGKYIQVLFPRSGIRFIAVNDLYDSAKVQGYTGNIIVPFKNLVNEISSADTSARVRSSQKTKREKGDFIGAFAVYGYMKDENNRNKLVPDGFAADVVRDIFLWKLNGLSAYSIAERLNTSGVLSPMEYKRYAGLRFSTKFKVNATAKWQAKAVFRILTNEVYLGVLEQGKRVTPNYKVRKRVDVPKEQWVRIEGAHEPVIERPLFNTVQELLKQDTRAASKNMNVRPLSGVIVCAGCGGAMVHKTNTSNGKRYGYYVCSNHRADKTVCSTHIISASACENAVLGAMKAHTSLILDIEKITRCAENLAYCQDSVRRLTTRLEAKRDEMKRSCEMRLSLHESYREGVINRDDFVSFKASYDEKIQDAEAAIITLKQEIEKAAAGEAENHGWIDVFKAYMNAETLDRKMVVELVEKIAVHENGRIEVIPRYNSEFERLSDAAQGVA